MRTERYHAASLLELFRERKIVTMPELKAALGTDVDVTVFRKLKELPYRTSYSHGGSFYTLNDFAEFDARGLWSHRSVHFSVHGSLLSTLEAFVHKSEAGYFVEELEHLLQVGVKESLLQLVRRERITREKMVRLFLYCSRTPSRRRRQILKRKILEEQPGLAGGVSLGRIVPDELKAAIVLFFSILDEQQRRLYAGLESLKFGHGGDEKIAELLGLDVRTIARGRNQLVARDLEIERVRKAGGGRKPLEKKRPK
jgi:hypothetical protein